MATMENPNIENISHWLNVQLKDKTIHKITDDTYKIIYYELFKELYKQNGNVPHGDTFDDKLFEKLQYGTKSQKQKALKLFLDVWNEWLWLIRKLKNDNWI